MVGGFGPDIIALRKFRFLGLLGAFVLCMVMYWALIFNDWCNMFYFKNTFSLAYV